MTEHSIYLGYWYQRTSLHLSEVYDFFRTDTSPLDLNKEKLKNFHSELSIKHVEFKIDVLEYIELVTTHGITVKYYEDGLVIMTKKFSDTSAAKNELSDYYENRFMPAVNYLFSLGAPTPRELATIKPVYPYFLVTKNASRDTIDKLLKDLGEEEYYELKNDDVGIYRGETHFVINALGKFDGVEQLIESFVFFSEFKAQLHQYLNLHRIIWQKIETIKEQGSISGKDISKQRNELESYKKTIELIDGRMEQMGLYIESRAGNVKDLGWETFLTKLLAFKYENLQHNLDYVKALWTMTRQYVDAAIQIFSELNQQSTKNSVTALTIISSIGVVGVILTHLAKTESPKITDIGMLYFVLLIGIALFINRMVNHVFNSMTYKIKAIEYKKNIN
jgi:hypothetical protein